MPDTYTCLKYHLVFATRQRSPWLVEPLRREVHRYMGGVIAHKQGVMLAVGGIEDHVHILAGFRPTVSVADMVRQIKASSSKWINERADFTDTFAWQVGYAAFTVSESQVPAVAGYILRQEQHHRRISTESELQKLVEHHGLTWEPPPAN